MRDRLEAGAITNVSAPPVLLLNENKVAIDNPAYREWEYKLHPALRSLTRRPEGIGKVINSSNERLFSSQLSTAADDRGEQMISVYIKTDGSQLSTYSGIEVLTQVGDIYVVRVPVSQLEQIASESNVRVIEPGFRRSVLNNSGRTDIGAHLVHQGLDLPAGYRGEGVIVGVLDTGIDYTHPDFSNANGTRIQFLGEYTQSGVLEWSKSQIDANPASVTQRDLDDGGGHGTHVTGSAAGGGIVNSDMRGVAPESDIIFFKGYIDGFFPDEAVTIGCQFIFDKADQLGKPAVINLSLGGQFGPLDGSSLYEQSLSNLTGPGRIIVAAAGNEGFEFMHAGGQLPATTRNVTVLEPHDDTQLSVNMWYKPGVISQVAVGAFYVEDGELFYLGNTNFVPVGLFMDFTPLIFQNEQNTFTLGYVGVDAQTTNDPNNGDGNILIDILGDPDNNVLLNNVYWIIFYDSNVSGQFDMWSFGGRFFSGTVGFDDVNEVPGDHNLTIGSPSTAHTIISVGSYVTNNSWTDIDGIQRQQLNPHPDKISDVPVVPDIGQRSFFSSIGPTRDGRIAPQISAPGEYIISPLSSHLNEGQGFQRYEVLQGGQYRGMEGTSMASPHVAGVVALLLQIDPTLTFEGVLQILQNTARADSHTGSLPNNLFGAGKIDAYAAVKSIAGGTGGSGDQTAVLRYFNPESEQRTYMIDAILPIDSGFVYGTNRYFDEVKATAFTLPPGQSEGTISQVKVWFGYRKDGLENETYRIVIYNGTADSGPQGDPIGSREYFLRDINADATLGNQREPTIHNFSEPVHVGSTFFAGIDFGSYDLSGIDRAGIVSTSTLGRRVTEEWERWNNGAWHNISDAWFSEQGGSGTGTNGANMWIEVTLGGTVSVPDDERSLPEKLTLEQNYPNPFNPVTVIQYALPVAAHVSLIVYDILGREVETLVDSEMNAGIHRVNFEANNLSSGLYIYRLNMGEQSMVRRMMLLR